MSAMFHIDDDIVISGIGGYFPKAKNIDELSTRLFNNESLVDSRWASGMGGVNNIIGTIPTNEFDNSYFGIHYEQCIFMDPMHRLILERCYEALIDAGVNPNEIKGKRVGTFMASSIGENDSVCMDIIIRGFGVTGHSRAMMPNRISYWLNLKGPSVAYDGNWVGGVEVLRLAYNAIKTGQCESCLVGAANLALNAEFQWLYADMGLVSPDGSTRAFDANANGYARSDGAVVFFVQKASDARRHYVSIVNIDTRFSGAHDGQLTDIDVSSMVEFMNDFYGKAGVDPNKVDFVEACGSANKEQDKKEIEALAKVYCKNRENPLLVGTIKSNTGHSESCAAFFGLAKILVAMEHEKIPANIQYKKPNPEIKPLIDGTVKVLTTNLPWNGEYAALNAIGIDSYYGHILLKANKKEKAEIKIDTPRLVLASTRTETGIEELLSSIRDRPFIDVEYLQLIQEIYSKKIAGHLYRGYLVLGAEAEIKMDHEYYSGNKRQVWFVYSGMGSQWNGMINDLMKFPVFAKAINKCQKVLEPKGIDLIHIISTDDKTIYDNILHSFVGIAAIQIALTDVLNSLGIVPDGIIGHSVGELGCAYADGCMTAEQMILSAYSRGRASLEADLIQGMMAAIGLGNKEIKDKCPPSIEVACHNGPDSSTISGPTEDMEKFVKELQDQGTFARLVNVSNIAYHSRYIKPAAPKLLEYLKQVIPVPMPRSSKWISTSNLEENWDTDLAKTSSAEYHTNNLLSSVLFEEGLKHIPKDAILIEIAPHGLLQAILKRSVKQGCTNIPLTQRNCKSSVEFLSNSLGKLYMAGIDMKVSNLYEKVSYPVSKGTPSLAGLAHWEHSESWKTGNEDKQSMILGIRDCQVTLNSEEFRECVGHQLNNKIILPISSYLNIVVQILANSITNPKDLIFENLFFNGTITIPKVGGIPLHTMAMKGSGQYEVLAEKEIVATGKVKIPETTEKMFMDGKELEISDDGIQLTGNDFYNEMNHRGHKYAGSYRCIKHVTIYENGSVAIIEWNKRWQTLIEGMIQLYLLHIGERNQEIHVPVAMQKVAISLTALPTERKDLKITYNQSTNVIFTDGLQIHGLRTAQFPRVNRPLCIDSVDIVPLYNPHCPNMENLINLALQLTLDNFNDQFITNVMITEIDSGNKILKGTIRKVLKEYTKLNPSVISVYDAKLINVQPTYPHLLILNDTINETVVKLLATSHGFLLARSDEIIQAYPQIVEVARQVVNGIAYSILRRANHTAPIVITIKSDTISSRDINRGSVQWIEELKTAVRVAAGKRCSIFLIASTVPVEGITNFVQELRLAFHNIDLRVHFMLDKKVTNVNPNDLYYQNIFQADLVLSVFKEGNLSTNIIVPVNIKEDIQTTINIRPNSIKDCTVKYIGINLYDETLLPPNKKKNELGNLDYVGVNKNGERVMGLARFDKDTSEIIADDILCWNVPEEWSLEDAGSAPHAYASAYYSLIVKGKLKSGDTVLINAAYTAIGIAAVSIANAMNCKTCITVSTDYQRAYLKKMFSLTNNEIYSCLDNSFKPKFMEATGGRGANVVLNCLTGSLLQESLNCLREFGTFIQIGRYDLKGDMSIGMKIFLKNASFIVVNLNELMNLPMEVKERIRDVIKDGVNSLAIRPIARKIVEHQNIEEILNTLSKPDHVGKILINVTNIDVSKFNIQKQDNFICNAKSSYLIYGGIAEVDTDLAEWLVFRGARKIVIASDAKIQQPWLSHRLSLLQSYYNVQFIFANPKAQTREGASELISEVYSLGPIHGVFILPNKHNTPKSSDIRPVQYIDNALKTAAPKALLINFITNAAGICHNRADAGFATCNISYQKELDFSETIQGLDNILNTKLKNIIIKSNEVDDVTQETTQALFKKLRFMLPNNIEEFTRNYKLVPSKPQLVQFPSLTPKEARETAPVFIISGISGYKEIKELAGSLLYPTYCAILPGGSYSIQDMAIDIVKQIKQVWQKGVYNFIAVSWGGALAIEIARLLNQEKNSIHIYFIDGSPSTLQAAVKLLGETPVNIEVGLLIKMLNLNASEVTTKIESAENWKDRLKVALDNYDKDFIDREEITKALTYLKNMVQELHSYEPSADDLISGQLHLLRPSGSSKFDNCNLTAYCKQTPNIQIITGDHRSIINSKETIRYVNETFQIV